MSFSDCVRDLMSDGLVEENRGRQAQSLWSEMADRYEQQGFRRANAEAMAAEEFKAIFKRSAAEDRHTLLAQVTSMRRSQGIVSRSRKLDTLMTDALEHAANSPNQSASVVAVKNALTRRFNAALSDLVKKHGRDILGRGKDQAGLRNIVRELHGESSGDNAALTVARSVRDALDEMRLAFNEAGGLISKLENWGLPHDHNRAALRKAGFDQWAGAVRDQLAWDKIPDRITGKPLAEAGRLPTQDVQDRVLREVWDNIVFGRESLDPQYGALQGESLVSRNSHRRVLHFRTADDWIEYNRAYGSGTPYSAIVSHAHKMARDIALMREFGPNPKLGYDYRANLATARARQLGQSDVAHKIDGNAEHGRRMMAILSGSLVPKGPMGEAVASFFSTTRHVLTAAFLDRAVIASISDLNSMRLAARTVGMNPTSVFKRHTDLIANRMTRDEALRAGWIADTLVNPGSALERFQSEVPPADLAERLSSGILRVQGLSGWTDYGRIAFQMELSGHIASQAGRPLNDVEEPLRSLLTAKSVTDQEWQAFTHSEHLFKAGNGTTFASPIYWRQATDLEASKADGVFDKLQAIFEEQTEFAVPTQSIWARAFVEGTQPPGTIGYEIAKSGLMFKSFALTFTVNQIRRIAAIPTLDGKIGYSLNLAAGATVMGAISLQITQLLDGQDPLQMDQPDFWSRAALKGGAFGIMGDIAASGSGRYGGIPSFVAGPIPQVGQDAFKLIFGNATELAAGKDTNAGREIGRALDRYTPGRDLPILGLAMDRLFWDHLQTFLDPESAARMTKRAVQQPSAGNSWWLPGSVTPNRAPGLSITAGQ